MSTIITLTLISAIGAAALFIALVVYLWLIVPELERIGGKARGYGEQASYLSKIRMGLRAIETQTGALPREATRLNDGLVAVRDGLLGVDANLAGLIGAVSRQEER